MELLIEFFSSYGYFAVFFVLLICGFGVPIPEDITLVSGGVISGLGYTNVHWMLVVSMIGVLVGDSTMYWLGRIYGEKILQFPLIRKIATPERFATVQERFEKEGWKLLFVARFLPGLRAVVYLVSGITRKVTFTRFVLVDFFAAIISVPIWVYLGDFGAKNLDWLHRQIQKGQMAIWVILIIGGIFVFWKWKKSRKAKSVNKPTQHIDNKP
ncbi:DedA family protein [Ursidibacter arcticus]|uniref:DedA family protein n=1 Tax=Ursidibacter arcticus TaxID=1524965 RepID=UPI0012F73BAA|nr:DedA family protein [Ursidibacter arcticus]KAE9534607.1 alpha-amylase [Ursidibacter arcticus]